MNTQHPAKMPDKAKANAKKSHAKRERTNGWDESIRTLLYAIGLALVFRSLLFEPFHIPSSSMKDTLLIGDYIFVSKYTYGYSRYSFPLGLPVFDGRVWQDVPKRGDVAVFRYPPNPQVDFIKRVIGLPGDTVQMQDGALYINGAKVPKTPDGSFPEKVIVRDDMLLLNQDSYPAKVSPEFAEKVGEETTIHVPRYREKLPEGKEYRVLDMTPFGQVDNTGVFTVPEKHYFLMGDNRDNSTDSRYPNAVGFVPEENLIGRAEFVFFSVDDSARLWEFWKWPWTLRMDRFFKGIE